MDITLKLTPHELDLIGNCLAEAPYKLVCGVLSKIQAQANDPTLQSPPVPGPVSTSPLVPPADGLMPHERPAT